MLRPKKEAPSQGSQWQGSGEAVSEGVVDSGVDSEEGTRIDNTLGALTKKFVTLIKEQPDKTIEIQQVSLILNIQKRRIYDITNVLEGIGYIEKTGKNKMKWVGGTKEPCIKQELQDLENQIRNWTEQQQRLDEQIQSINQKIRAEFVANAELNYLHEQDLRRIMNRTNSQRMLVYCGEDGDHLHVGSNSETGDCQFTIESNNPTESIYYCMIPPKIASQSPISIRSLGINKKNQGLKNLKDEQLHKQNHSEREIQSKNKNKKEEKSENKSESNKIDQVEEQQMNPTNGTKGEDIEKKDQTKKQAEQKKQTKRVGNSNSQKEEELIQKSGEHKGDDRIHKNKNKYEEESEKNSQTQKIEESKTKNSTKRIFGSQRKIQTRKQDNQMLK